MFYVTNSDVVAGGGADERHRQAAHGELCLSNVVARGRRARRRARGLDSPARRPVRQQPIGAPSSATAGVPVPLRDHVQARPGEVSASLNSVEKRLIRNVAPSRKSIKLRCIIRQRMIVAVPSEVNSYIITDLRYDENNAITRTQLNI